MGWTLRLVFEGLCAFVTDTPLYERRSGDWHPTDPVPKKLTVLLPALHRPALASWAAIKNLSEEDFRAPHFPLLIVDRSNYRPESTRFIDMEMRTSASPQDKAVFLLQSESITLPPAGRNSLLFKTTRSAEQIPQSGEESSLWWLPNLAEIAPTSCLFDSKLEPMPGTALDGRLAAALTIDHGNVFSFGHNFPSIGAREPTVWRFAPRDHSSPDTWNRAVANQIAVELPDLTAPVTFHLEQVIDSNPIQSQIVVSPPGGSRQSLVEVRVVNMELEKLFGEAAPLPPGHGKVVVDADFESFYALTTSPPSKPFIPQLPPKLMALGPIKQPCAPLHTTFQGA